MFDWEKDARHETNQAWMKENPGYHKQYYQENKTRLAALQRLRRFGITQAQWDTMFTSQGNRCAICKSSTTNVKRGWQVDHCHETGKVRGILCNVCNVGLGHFKDDPAALRAAAEYIEAHK